MAERLEINRRDMLRTAGLSALFLFALRPTSRASGGARPNIIFILADDVGAESMDMYGGSSWTTPNINSIAEAGMLFENAFSCPCCAPTRAQFLTGRYPFRTGITYPTLPNGPLSTTGETTVATVLKSGGYSTGLAGKWNLRYGSAKGASETEQAAHIRAHGFEEHRAFIGHTIQYGPPSPESDFVPYKLNRWACDFIARKALEPKPFYLQYSLGLVHWPLTATPLDSDSTADDSSDAELYAGMMQYMDDMVGNVLDVIDTARIAGNTVVVFGGDNGTWSKIASTYKGMAIQGGKLSAKDTGSRVPFYVRWPGAVAPGSTYSGLMDFSDIFPTFIEIAEEVVPNHRIIDGKSFLPQLKGQAGEHREFVFSMDQAAGKLVRDKHWKRLIGDGLYDISNSPFEEILIPEESQTQEQAKARSRLLGYYEQIIGKELSDTGDR